MDAKKPNDLIHLILENYADDYIETKLAGKVYND